VSQAGGELKYHWAHFQSIFLRRLCLSKIGQVPINAVAGNVEASTQVTGKPTKRALGLFLRGTLPGIGGKLLFSLRGI
jgi:hypothetical protein